MPILNVKLFSVKLHVFFQTGRKMCKQMAYLITISQQICPENLKKLYSELERVIVQITDYFAQTLGFHVYPC